MAEVPAPNPSTQDGAGRQIALLPEGYGYEVYVKEDYRNADTADGWVPRIVDANAALAQVDGTVAFYKVVQGIWFPVATFPSGWYGPYRPVSDVGSVVEVLDSPIAEEEYSSAVSVPAEDFVPDPDELAIPQGAQYDELVGAGLDPAVATQLITTLSPENIAHMAAENKANQLSDYMTVEEFHRLFPAASDVDEGEPQTDSPPIPDPQQKAEEKVSPEDLLGEGEYFHKRLKDIWEGKGDDSRDHFDHLDEDGMWKTDRRANESRLEQLRIESDAASAAGPDPLAARLQEQLEAENQTVKLHPSAQFMGAPVSTADSLKPEWPFDTPGSGS